MRRKLYGGKHPSEFLDIFFGDDAFTNGSVPGSCWNNDVKSSFQNVTKPEIINDGTEIPPSESVMGKRLAIAIRKCIDTKAFEYIDTHSHLDVNENVPKTGADGTLYAKSSLCPSANKPDSTFLESTTEIKRSDAAALVFQDDPNKGFEEKTTNSTNIRGQLAAYAVAPLMFQHRNHFFTVFIRGSTARLIRWDRAGAIVTEEFNYGQESYLADFYWRFTHATAKARGHDTTVRRLSDTKDHDLVCLVRGKLDPLGLKVKEPVFEIKVWDDTPETVNEGLPYYSLNPFVNHAHSVTGRATRVFRVWDPRMKKVVALKDCWRVNSSSILPEGHAYEILKENHVRNIPTCLRAGDVDPGCAYQRTQTQDVLSSARTTRSHIHYRIVLEEVCIGNITGFEDTKELVSVLRDSLIAHTDAYTKAGILHRDVSAGNILITEDRRGLLGDWELSKLVVDLSTARQPQRTGTWQFISAALLQLHRPCHSLKDDLESFVHVFSWTCLKHVKNMMMPSQLGEHLSSTTKSYSIALQIRCSEE
ncbi:hypothetical protein K435DRAFT_753266 [Dendrothele bispora CBS 962.96]|uniref:Fungal-type protein kinase domain-containing protein n=1 Tax=Dendrothele bispora (strain CBS 962.96) TaxID=1314807 RepID=A0A4S8M891_DENBC|nr:hypothetical protein K435DRAFT_753266 [Dendrothele bispora CBS 962.96]